jgi:hypothetical protein
MTSVQDRVANALIVQGDLTVLADVSPHAIREPATRSLASPS